MRVLVSFFTFGATVLISSSNRVRTFIVRISRQKWWVKRRLFVPLIEVAMSLITCISSHFGDPN